MAKSSPQTIGNHISVRLPDHYLQWLETHRQRYGLKSRHELAKILLMQAIDETRSRETLTQISQLRQDLADALEHILYEALDVTEEDAIEIANSLRTRGTSPPPDVY